jgi:hypothetical protein
MLLPGGRRVVGADDPAARADGVAASVGVVSDLPAQAVDEDVVMGVTVEVEVLY